MLQLLKIEKSVVCLSVSPEQQQQPVLYVRVPSAVRTQYRAQIQVRVGVGKV